MSLYPRGQREVQKSNCKQLEQELGIEGSSTQRNKKVFKESVDAQREAFELASEPLDYMCPTSPHARQCALEYCEAGDRAQKMWPANGSRAGVPCWPREKELILRALTHYITLRAYHVYQSQHRSPNPKPNAGVDRIGADHRAEQADISATLQSRPNPRPHPRPDPSPAGIAGLSNCVQHPSQVPTPAVVAIPENSLAIAYNLEFEKKYADEIKSLDPIHDNRSGPEEFTREWLSDPNERWPSEQLYPTIDRRLKRLLLLRDTFNAADLKEIEKTSKILRNKSEIQDLSGADEKEFNLRLAARVKYHVHRFIANGWIVRDNKTNKLRKTEIFSKLWSIYYFNRNHASKVVGEKATGSNPLDLTAEPNTSAGPVSVPASQLRTRILQSGSQQIAAAAPVPNSAVTKATTTQASKPPVLNTLPSKVVVATARDGAQSKTSDVAATSSALINIRASAEHLVHQVNAGAGMASQQSPVVAAPPKLTPFESAPTIIRDNLGSTKQIYTTNSIIPTRRRSNETDFGSSREKRHKPSIIDRASSNVISFENLATRSSSLFMTPEPAMPIPVNRFRFAEDDIEQSSSDANLTQVKVETEIAIDTKPVVEMTQIPETPNRSQAPSPTDFEEWRIHDFPKSAQTTSSTGKTLAQTSHMVSPRDASPWMSTSSRADRQTTPPTSDDEDMHHHKKVKPQPKNSPQSDQQRLVFIVEKFNGRLDIDYDKNITYSQLQRSNVYQFFELFAAKSGAHVYQLGSLMFTFLFAIGNDVVVEAGDEDEWRQVKERIDVLFKLKSRLEPGLLDFKVVIGKGAVC